MTAAFVSAAAALVALAWSLLWMGQRRAGERPGAGRTNVALLDAEVAALDAEHGAGRLDPARHAAAVGELQRRLLAESAPGLRATAPDAAPWRLVAGLGLALPLFVASGYFALGNPAAIGVTPAAAAANDEVSPDEMRQMLDSLSRQLQSRPAGRAEDLPGWVMLARGQASLRRFGEAASAYERAVALAPDDAQLLADLADVLTVLQAPGAAAADGGATAASDRVDALIDRALAADPRNLKALSLAGNAAYSRRDVPAAVGFWQRARALTPADSDFAKGLDQNLAAAGAGADGLAGAGTHASAGTHVDAGTGTGTGTGTRAGAGAGAGAGTVTRTDGGTGERSRPVAADARAAAAAGRNLVGDVHLAPALADRVRPGDTLFIFARAEHGPRMPLAIVRRTATDVSQPFVLDDSTSMAPELRLSNFGAVVVGARISRSGNAMPQTGDLVGEVRADVGTGRVSIVIDRIQP